MKATRIGTCKAVFLAASLAMGAPRVARAQDAAAAVSPPAERRGAAAWGGPSSHGRANDLLGAAVSASQGAIGAEDLEDLPLLLRRGELLEAVPRSRGHAALRGRQGESGYFLRGFNLDHGTDFAFSGSTASP